jgi:hypothetical protein
MTEDAMPVIGDNYPLANLSESPASVYPDKSKVLCTSVYSVMTEDAVTKCQQKCLNEFPPRIEDK